MILTVSYNVKFVWRGQAIMMSAERRGRSKQGLQASVNAEIQRGCLCRWCVLVWTRASCTSSSRDDMSDGLSQEVAAAHGAEQRHRQRDELIGAVVFVAFVCHFEFINFRVSEHSAAGPRLHDQVNAKYSWLVLTVSMPRRSCFILWEPSSSICSTVVAPSVILITVFKP